MASSHLCDLSTSLTLSKPPYPHLQDRDSGDHAGWNQAGPVSDLDAGAEEAFCELWLLL